MSFTEVVSFKLAKLAVRIAVYMDGKKSLLIYAESNAFSKSTLIKIDSALGMCWWKLQLGFKLQLGQSWSTKN